MKNIIGSLLFFLVLSTFGCSNEDQRGANNSSQYGTGISQAETMEEIWASSLEPAEKARRVQELLAQSGN